MEGVASESEETATLVLSAPPARRSPSRTSRGSTLSRYVVLEEIGRGGTGRVLRAYDPKLRREVALKLVRRETRDDVAIGMLVEEALAMANVTHRNVVALYDAEETDGPDVVLVMEYVAGGTLKEWLQRQPHTWPEIVGRFVAAGRGLAAAHEAGLLHRDFKPSNVLLTCDGTVKVADFGLAVFQSPVPLSTDGPASAERTVASTVMGTPRYMAPEQHRGARLTPAADQYAFCVALWQALCGEPPFAGPTLAEDKFAGPPPWTHGTTPRPIVDAIVRGLAPRPDARWASMDALLAALQWDPARHRRRWLVAGGAAASLGLASLWPGAWTEAQSRRCAGASRLLEGIWDDGRRRDVQAAFAGVGKSYADDAWTRTEQALDRYAGDWAAMHTEACEATTIRNEQPPAIMDLRMACLRGAAVQLRAAVEVLSEADAEVVEKAHEVTSDLRPLALCADTDALTATVDPPSPDEAAAVEVARTSLARAHSLRNAGKYEEARRAVQETQTALSDVEYGPVRTELALTRGRVLEALGDYGASRAALEDALRRGYRWMQWDAAQQAATKLMFVVAARLQRPEDALVYRSLSEGLSHNDPLARSNALSSVASILDAQGEYAEAEAQTRAALTLRETVLGPDHPTVAVSRSNLASDLLAQGKYADAEVEARSALASLETALGNAHPRLAGAHNNLANALFGQAKYTQAEDEFRTALALQERALSSKHPKVAGTRNNLAVVLHAQGKLGEAEDEFRAVLELRETTLGPDHPEVAESRENLAAILHLRDKNVEAESQHRAALAVFESTAGPDSPRLAQTRYNLAAVLFHLGRSTEARSLTELAWSRLGADDIPTAYRGTVAFLLARLVWETSPRERPRAVALAQDAKASYASTGSASAADLRTVQQWLDEHPLQ